MASAPGSSEPPLRQWGRHSSVEQPPAPASSPQLSEVGSAACPADPHCTWPSDQKMRPPWGPAWRLRSEGDQRLHLWTESHSWRSRLLLKQHLGRQFSQPGIALPAERQIIKQLPAALLQAGFAGQRSNGRAPRRTPPPAGGHVSTLEAPPDHEEGRSGAPTETWWSRLRCTDLNDLRLDQASTPTTWRRIWTQAGRRSSGKLPMRRRTSGIARVVMRLSRHRDETFRPL